MPESLIDGTGSGNLARVNSEGRLLVDISGATINIGSVSANVDSIYVQSGTFYQVSGNTTITNLDEIGSKNWTQQVTPTDLSQNNPAWKFEYIISGTSTGALGSSVGSVTQFIGVGSYVNVLTYSNGFITNIGSYV